MTEINWCISLDYPFGNTRTTQSILKALNYEQYKIFYGINIYDSCILTDREHAIREKIRIFDQYLEGNLDRKSDIIFIEELTKTFVAQHSAQASIIFNQCPNISLRDIFATISIEDDKVWTDTKCVFATLYCLSVLSKICHPPIRGVAKTFDVKRVRFIEKDQTSMERIICDHYYPNNKSEEYYIWYEIDNLADIENCMFDDRMHLILGTNENSICDYAYYINHVHIGRELCAIQSKSTPQIELLALLNANFVGTPFEPFNSNMIDNFHL